MTRRVESGYSFSYSCNNLAVEELETSLSFRQPSRPLAHCRPQAFGLGRGYLPAKNPKHSQF